MGRRHVHGQRAARSLKMRNSAAASPIWTRGCHAAFGTNQMGASLPAAAAAQRRTKSAHLLYLDLRVRHVCNRVAQRTQRGCAQATLPSVLLLVKKAKNSLSSTAPQRVSRCCFTVQHERCWVDGVHLHNRCWLEDSFHSRTSLAVPAFRTCERRAQMAHSLRPSAVMLLFAIAIAVLTDAMLVCPPFCVGPDSEYRVLQQPLAFRGRVVAGAVHLALCFRSTC